MLRDRDIIVISPQWWGDFWVSKHWISYELSKHNRVLFVGPSIWLGGVFRKGYRREIFGSILKNHRRVIKENLFVFSPYLIPHKVTKRRNSDSGTSGILHQIQREIARLGFKDSIVINFTTKHFLVKELTESVSVYYCVDPAFPDPGEEEHEKLICQKSDLVFAISEKYREDLQRLTPKKSIEVIPHGYDYAKAQQVMNDNGVEKPRELLNLQPPILGFIGSIHSSYVDVELLTGLARKRRNWNFVLIGPYKDNPIGPSLPAQELRQLKSEPNILLMGSRKFWELPRYIKFFDVGMILLNTRAFGQSLATKRRTNFKINQYFAQGKPIVSPWLDELTALSDLVYMGDTVYDYARGIEEALVEDRSKAERRMCYASDHSFDNILNVISTLITDCEQAKKKKNLSEGDCQ